MKRMIVGLYRYKFFGCEYFYAFWSDNHVEVLFLDMEIKRNIFISYSYLYKSYSSGNNVSAVYGYVYNSKDSNS